MQYRIKHGIALIHINIYKTLIAQKIIMCIMCIQTSSKQIIKLLEKDGWYLHNQKGSHQQFKHLTKTGKVTVPHPKKDLPIGTVKCILKQAGL